MTRLAFPALFLFLAVAAVKAQNWPQFRGPGASGVVEGRPAVAKWDVAKSENIGPAARRMKPDTGSMAMWLR
jgi:hypothetical protein